MLDEVSDRPLRVGWAVALDLLYLQQRVPGGTAYVLGGFLGIGLTAVSNAPRGGALVLSCTKWHVHPQVV